MVPQVGFVVAQELGATQRNAALGEQGLHAGGDVHQHFVVEEPGRSGQDVGSVAADFIHHHAHVLVDGGRHHFPLQTVVIGHLGMQGGQGQRRVGIRTVQVYPKYLHLV